jgi:2-polyprenyl-3-methyl-5-hydroxy-6-metoxy-1,4-benzoquinol methylase
MNPLFTSENDHRCLDLRKRLDAFYESTKDYTAFQEANYKPEFWESIKNTIKACIIRQNKCRVLEVGAGCTGFSSYIEDIRSDVVFDVQDVTIANQEYLLTQANKVYIGDVQQIQEKYDVIFSTFVWEHITTPKKTLDYLLNLLNPGGSIFIVSPRYDFPFYLSPSSKHLSRFDYFKTSIWLFYQRLKVIFGGQPEFIIHLDPSLFYRPWFRDADAIHWVSIYDLKSYLPKHLKFCRLRIPVQGLKGKIWESFLLLFVEIQKPSNN